MASKNDVLWLRIDREKPMEIDIDKRYDLQDIKCVMAFEDKFYVLANKHHRCLGYYLLDMDAELDQNLHKCNFVIKWVNKLDIGDAGLDMMKIEEGNKVIS